MVAASVGRSVVVCDAEGTTRREVGSGSWQMHPSFSPDGSELAYASYRRNEGEEVPNWGLYASQPDGSEERLITPNLGWTPRWSPDGTKMLYTGGKHDRFGTYVKDLVTGSERAITPEDGAFEIEHEWSPDGKKIVLESARGLFGVYVTDGEKERQLFTNQPYETHDSDPVWHPDGKSVAIESTPKVSGSTNIWRINAEGYGSYPLTEDYSQNVDPVFSKDGEWLAFSSNREGSYDIYVAREDGSDLRRLTDLPGDEYAPAFSPNGQQIAFISSQADGEDLGLVQRRCNPRSVTNVLERSDTLR